MTSGHGRRFWSKVAKAEGDACWEWQGARSSDGYGSFKLAGAMRGAHRVAWELANGSIPAGAHVLHRCDNPGCVRPGHLFLGDEADNAADRESKGRGNHAAGDRNGSRLHRESRPRGERHGLRIHPEAAARGERVGNARLTESAVREIRAAHAAGVSNREIARRVGVGPTAINDVVSGRTWRHVA